MTDTSTLVQRGEIVRFTLNIGTETEPAYIENGSYVVMADFLYLADERQNYLMQPTKVRRDLTFPMFLVEMGKVKPAIAVSYVYSNGGRK